MESETQVEEKTKVETKTRVKKAEKQRYVSFVQSEATQNALQSISRHLQQRYLREGFLSLTGIKISEYQHYKLMKAIKNNQATIGEKKFVII
jgi:hypothetical protein